MQKPARSKGELHTYERSVFPQSHYVAKYMLTCLVLCKLNFLIFGILH